MRRKQIYTLVASDHGTLIVNRMDCHTQSAECAIGVGIELLERGCYQPEEVDMAVGILELRRRYHGDGVVAIDGGANIGVHAVEWAKSMTDWGKVIAVEPQERIYYALAGNIAINNCFNACALHAALGAFDGTMEMPVPDYSVASNFGALSLNRPNDIGQTIRDFAPVQVIKIDSLALDRCDLLKLDIEGMESDALAGAETTIDACRPVLMVEHICSDMGLLLEAFENHGYEAFRFGMNLIAVHRLDKVLDHIRQLHRALLRSEIERAA